MADAQSDALLGRVALKSFDLQGGTAELAYWIVPSARGRGLCPRAAMVATRWALYERGFHRVELEHASAKPRLLPGGGQGRLRTPVRIRGRAGGYSGGLSLRKYVQLVSFGSLHFSGARANSGWWAAM